MIYSPDRRSQFRVEPESEWCSDRAFVSGPTGRDLGNGWTPLSIRELQTSLDGLADRSF